MIYANDTYELHIIQHIINGYFLNTQKIVMCLSNASSSITPWLLSQADTGSAFLKLPYTSSSLCLCSDVQMSAKFLPTFHIW